MRNVLIPMGVGLIILLSSCHGSHETTHEGHTLTATTPIRKDTSIVQKYVSQIHAVSHIELRAQERGYLQKIYVDEGQFVHEGDLLFQIMPNLYRAEWEKAKAEMSFAQIEYDNTKQLADSGVVAMNELYMAKAKLDKALAELQLAEVHLQFTEIRAPFDGIIDRFHVRLGSLLDEGELLTTLSDNHEMWVYFNLSEAEYLNYRERVKKDSVMTVRLEMANLKQFKHTGEVRTIEADFNNETGNIAFRATFPNPEGLLRHGETGNVLMRVPLRNALLIPQKATFEVLDKKFVFVIDDKDHVTAREVTIGEEMPHLYAITKGLSESDVILLDGIRLVRSGDHVVYDKLEASEVLHDLDLYAE